MWVVHQQPCAVYHKAAVCSKATCFTFLTFLVTLVVPLLLVYRSQGKAFRVSYICKVIKSHISLVLEPCTCHFVVKKIDLVFSIWIQQFDALKKKIKGP